MIKQYFNVKGKDRLIELQKFIKSNMKTCRFNNNPLSDYSENSDKYWINISYDSEDQNKLNVLQNKWYEIDNPKIVKKSFFSRLFSRVKDI